MLDQLAPQPPKGSTQKASTVGSKMELVSSAGASSKNGVGSKASEVAGNGSKSPTKTIAIQHSRLARLYFHQNLMCIPSFERFVKKRKHAACIYLLYLRLSTLQLSRLVDPKLIDVLGHSAKDKLEESLASAVYVMAAERIKESEAKMNAAIDKFVQCSAVCSH